MGKIIFEFFQDQSLLKNSNTHDLSILIGVDRFSFMVSDIHQNVIAIKSYQYLQELSPNYSLGNAVKDVFRSDQLLTIPYQSVRIGIQNSKNTLLPSSLFNPEELDTYLQNIIDFPSTDQLFADRISELNVHQVYAINFELSEVLQNYFPEALFYHSQTASLKGFSKLAAVQSGHQIFINIHEKVVQVSAFVGRDLLFNNSFPFESPNDFIYYLLLVYNQFQLKTDIVPLTISGFLVEDSKIYHLLYRYIRFLNMVQPPDYYRFPDKLKEENLHFYFDLYSLRLCE